MKIQSCLLHFVFGLIPLLGLGQDSTQVRRLETFTKLTGYLRFFHASDESAATPWSGFAQYGVERILQCKDEAHFQQTLQQLFAPVAPTLLIQSSAHQPGLVPIPHSVEKNGAVVAWQHHGVGLDDQPDLYFSMRTHSPPKPFTNVSQVSLCQYLDARPYAGKRVRLSIQAQLESPDGGAAAQLWLRADPSESIYGRPVFSKALACTGSATLQVELEIPGAAERLYIGVILHRRGDLTITNPQLTMQLTDIEQVISIPNASFQDFQGKVPSGWLFGQERMGERALTGYYTAERKGEQSLLIRPGLKTADRESGKGLFKKLPAPKQYFEADIGSGLRAFFPLSVYRVDGHTYPKVDSTQFAQFLAECRLAQLQHCQPEDLVVRLGHVVLYWPIFRHFFPYWSDAGFSPDAFLQQSLKGVWQWTTAADYLRTLRTLTAPLNDGHINVSCMVDSTQNFSIPVLVAKLGDTILIDKVDPSWQDRLKAGDILRSVDGQSAQVHAQQYLAQYSGSTQWKLSRLQAEFFKGAYGSEINLEIEREGQIKTVKGNRNQFYYSNYSLRDKRRPSGWIEEGIYYIDLNQWPMDSIRYHLSEIRQAKAFIADLRGYPTGQNHGLLSWLMKGEDRNDWMFVPKVQEPDQRNVEWYGSSWHVKGEKGMALPMPVYFITDGRAISYAESYMGYVKDFKLATIVGEPTAGANGNVNFIHLPGGYQIMFTGMMVKNHDGSKHHQVGIEPDFQVRRTREGVATNQDELLNFTLALIKR